jgi:hypothetical protein
MDPNGISNLPAEGRDMRRTSQRNWETRHEPAGHRPDGAQLVATAAGSSVREPAQLATSAAQGPPPEVRYLFLFAGDDRAGELHGESYVERLRAVLFQGWGGLAGEVVHAGHSGETVRSLLARIDTPLRKYRPHRVILSVGANDVWLPWLCAWGPLWRIRSLVRRIQYGQAPTRDLDGFAAAYRMGSVPVAQNVQ